MLTVKKPEKILLGVMLTLLALAVGGPWLAQPAHHHDFADQRVWCSIPFAMDVFTNLPFALWGALGLGLCAAMRGHNAGAARRYPGAQQGLAALFFAGLLLTAAASSWYHLQPDNAGLVFDRLGMTVAFAGLIGLAAAGRISARAGLLLAGTVLLLGPSSIGVWFITGNIFPWAVLQFGGMALVLWLACLKPPAGAWPIGWLGVIVIYTAAKLLELGDQQVFELTGHWVSGHSLKHIVASFAALPVVLALRSLMAGELQLPALPKLVRRGIQTRAES